MTIFSKTIKSEWLQKGASINHVDSEGGFLKKPCRSTHKEEGVLEAGPRGQIFLTYYSTKCSTTVWIWRLYVNNYNLKFCEKYATTYD